MGLCSTSATVLLAVLCACLPAGTPVSSAHVTYEQVRAAVAEDRLSRGGPATRVPDWWLSDKRTHSGGGNSSPNPNQHFGQQTPPSSPLGSPPPPPPPPPPPQPMPPPPGPGYWRPPPPPGPGQGSG